MAKKTFSVEQLRVTVNHMLAESTCSPEERLGMIAVMEHVLTATGNYGGFRLLTQNEVPEGELPGIRIAENGHPLISTERFVNTDGSRRRFPDRG